MRRGSLRSYGARMRAGTGRLPELLSQLRRELEAVYGERLVRLVLFGSQARGDDEPGSDIDVLVVLRGLVAVREEIEQTGEIVARLSLVHDEVISLVFAGQKRVASRVGPLLRNIEREGIAL